MPVRTQRSDARGSKCKCRESESAYRGGSALDQRRRCWLARPQCEELLACWTAGRMAAICRSKEATGRKSPLSKGHAVKPVAIIIVTLVGAAAAPALACDKDEQASFPMKSELFQQKVDGK